MVLAKTDKSAPGDPFEFQRSYPGGDLFGQITGFFNFSFGAAGVEQTYNDELSGNAVSQEYQTLRDLFIEHDSTGDVTLTMRADVQQVARDALGERNGAVVAIDPRDGSILAMWSFPSFDPNPLASHDGKASQAAKGRSTRPTRTARCGARAGRSGSSRVRRSSWSPARPASRAAR